MQAVAPEGLVVPLEQGEAALAATAGAGGPPGPAVLAKLAASGIPVPPGFVLTAQAYERFLRDNGARGAGGAAAPGTLAQAAVGWDLAAAISGACRDLCVATGDPDLWVGVWPAGASRHQMQPARGSDGVVEQVRRAWAQGAQGAAAGPAIAVHALVEAEACGEVVTLARGGWAQVRCAWGSYRAAEAGRVRPDRFLVDRATLRIAQRQVLPKQVEWLRGPDPGRPIEDDVPPERQRAPCLTDSQVQDATRLALAVEACLGAPQRVRFGFEVRPGGRRLLVLDAVPLASAPAPGARPSSRSRPRPSRLLRP